MSRVSCWVIIVDHVSLGLCTNVLFVDLWIGRVSEMLLRAKGSQGYRFWRSVWSHTEICFPPFIWPVPVTHYFLWPSCKRRESAASLCPKQKYLKWSEMWYFCLIKCLPRNVSLQEVRSSVHHLNLFMLSCIFSPSLPHLNSFHCCYLCACVKFCLKYYSVLGAYGVTALPSGPRVVFILMKYLLNLAVMMRHQFVCTGGTWHDHLKEYSTEMQHQSIKFSLSDSWKVQSHSSKWTNRQILVFSVAYFLNFCVHLILKANIPSVLSPAWTLCSFHAYCCVFISLSFSGLLSLFPPSWSKYVWELHCAAAESSDLQTRPDLGPTLPSIK